MKNKVGDQEGPLATSVWTNKRKGRVRSKAEEGGIKGTTPVRFSNHRPTTTRVSGQNSHLLLWYAKPQEENFV